MKTRTKTFIYNHNGVDYQVNVIYKMKKNIAYRFRNNEFIVTSPFFVNESKIRSGLDKFADYLINRSKKIEASENDPRIFLFGDELILNEEQVIHTKYGNISYNDRDDLINKLKKVYGDVMIERTRYYENLMGVNPPYKVKIKTMTSRYGSNSSQTHTIAYSDKLYSYDINILDSLVVHELAHHFVRDHSKKFYSVVFKYCPNYYKDNKKLKKRIYR